ncbi:MAG: tetratricopeptide repeat protein [Bacteroidia bacterium]|nr:tetratricopeptide repeat protein [Bacteroidia bacterium]
MSAGYRLAIARCYYDLGDRNNAITFAEQVINQSPEYVRFIRYDALNGLTNEMQTLSAEGVDDFQPLPRLDFLDPKYSGATAIEEAPIAILKAEEAYFILAEAQIADNQLVNAQTTLKTLLALIAQRPVKTIDDSAENRGREGGNRQDYPNNPAYLIAASPNDPLLGGLVLDRQAGPVSVPAISGTSVDSAAIDLANTEETLLELLYLMRQEVFIAEARRMFDLGIKFPISQIEVNNNANIEPNSPFIQAQIPDFIPGNFGMDEFTANEANLEIVINFNMNRILVQNRASEFVLPFH